ncbi:MAG: FecR family protein [Chitinophagales bacterium]
MNTSIEHIIIRHLNETASVEEEQQLKVWLQESEANQAEFEATQKVWNLTEDLDADIDFDTEAEWEDFQATIEAPTIVRTLEPAPKKRQLFGEFLKIAAVFVFMLGSVWIAKQFTQPSGTIAESVKVQTFRGMEKEVALEDGTKIWLNENSILTYPESFDDKERKVRLVGEAFFEVERDENRPFIIMNKDTETRVLGTSFNVRTSQESVAVTVRTGKVSLTSRADKGKSVVLEAGDKGVFDVKKKALDKGKIGDNNDWAWQTKRLVFRDAPISRVINVVNKYYNIQMDAKDKSVLNCQFTSEFEAASLEEVLEVLEGTLEIEIKEAKGIYWMEGKGC